MKKALCILLSMFLFLCSAGVAEESGYTLADGDGAAPSAQEGEPDKDGGLQSGSLQNTIRPQSYEDIAVTGPYAWQVMDGFIRCFDVRTQSKVAELPLSALYPETEDYLALTACGDALTLCAVTNAGPDCRVSLYSLSLEDGAVAAGPAADATGKLAFLFDGKTRWMEVDLTACAGGLLVTAMDSDKVIRMYLYDPASGELTELGTRTFETFSAVFPYGDGLLISGAAENDLETEELTAVSLPGGEQEVLGSFRVSAMYRTSCMALDEAGQTLYFFADGIGYRIKIGAGTDPEPFCAAPKNTAWLRYGRVTEGFYVFLDEEGSLLYQDTSAVTEISKLRILDLTGADLSEVTQAFSAENPEYLAVVTPGDNANDILTAMLNQSADYDAYIVSLGSDVYRALHGKGYLGSLEGSETLTAAAAAFPDRIRERIFTEGKLSAFPVGVQNTALLLDVAGITALTGLSREEIPTDWGGFLKLLQQIGEDGLLDGSGRCLFESGLSVDSFRINLLSMILQDALLWLNADESRLSAMQASLTPVLQAMDETNWQNLGLPEDEGDDEVSDEEVPALMEWVNPEISVMDLREGTEYWPLSLTPEGERLVPQDVYVIFLNPRSAHPEGVVRFTEALYRGMDPVTRMELEPGLNEPVKNERYDEDIEYMRALVPVYEQAIADAADEDEAGELQAELDEMLAYMDQYEKNGAWLVNEESIALYRPLEELFAVHGDEFWYDETENTIFLQYADRLIGPDQFVRQLVSTLQMARMETD